MFVTIYNSEYNGIIEKIEPDGYFFKSGEKRVLYLKNTEIKSFQTYSINRSKLNALEKQIPSLNADISNSINNKKEEGLIEINKLSSITGENIIIFLKDHHFFSISKISISLSCIILFFKAICMDM